MIVLFIHQNFPAQYLHLARHLGSLPGNQIYFLTQRSGPPIPGVEVVLYTSEAPLPLASHPYTQVHEFAVHTGLAVLAACRKLKARGVVPDIVIGHSGWGETLLVKQAFPDTPVLAYFEYFYHPSGADVGYDPEFAPKRPDDEERLWLRNSINHLSLASCDAGHTATQWQRSLFPAEQQHRIHVLHEGVDTEEVRPDPLATFELPDGRVLSRDDEVITYVARNLEPYRGFHCLMRALPEVLRKRPKAQVLIAGADGVSYGDAPPYAGNWRALLVGELRERLDLSKVHFVGQIPRKNYLKLLQVSRLHVYFTYPFVLSWSCIEALAAGCLVLGSRVPPVAEVIQDGQNGLLVDMLRSEAVAARMIGALDDSAEMERIRGNARAAATAMFDVRLRCTPSWIAAINKLTNQSPMSLSQ